jgi:hypothetical protein
MLSPNYCDGDLIMLEDGTGKVHIVWTDHKYGRRICRPSMIVTGTGGEGETSWRILKRGVHPEDFTREVKGFRIAICEECLILCPGATPSG